MTKKARKYIKRIFRIVILFFLITSVIIASGLIYAYKIEPEWIQIKKIELALPHLEPEFNGWQILQISDIHISDWMSEERLENIVNLINQQNPDIIVLTGDFLSNETRYFERLFKYYLSLIIPFLNYENPANTESILPKTEEELNGEKQVLINTLSQLNPKYYSFAVLGNHDHWVNSRVVTKALRDSKIIELKNQVYTIAQGKSYLNIAGVDDFWTGYANLNLILAKLPNRGATILLSHEPDFAAESAITDRFDLQLSGHSHGGQINIPFFGPPILPPFARIYPQGIYQVKDMIQYTNRGIGMTRPFVRFNCRPEITVFTLKSPYISNLAPDE